MEVCQAEMEERKNIPARRPTKHPGERSTRHEGEAGRILVSGKPEGFRWHSRVIWTHQVQGNSGPSKATVTSVPPLYVVGWGTEPWWELEKVPFLPGRDSFVSKCNSSFCRAGAGLKLPVAPSARCPSELRHRGRSRCRARPCRQELSSLVLDQDSKTMP